MRHVVLFVFCFFGGFLIAQVDEDNFTSQDYVWMGDKACDDGKWVDGISFYKKGLYLDSSNAMACVQLARAYHFLKDYSMALVFASDALKIDSNLVKAHEYSAVLYSEIDQLDSAELHLLQIIRIDEKSPTGYYGMAKVKTVERDFDAAVIYARKALELFESEQASETGEAQYLVGILELYRGEYDDARSMFTFAQKNGVRWDPEVVEFMMTDKKILLTPQSYKATEMDVINGLSYLIQNKALAEDEQRKKISRFILEWIGGVPYLSVDVTNKLVPYIEYGEAFVVYLAASVKFKVENPEDPDIWKSTLIATQTVIQYYLDNKGYYGKSKELNKLVKLQKKNKLVEFIKSNYD